MSVHRDGRSPCGLHQYWRARPANGSASKGKFLSQEDGAEWLAVRRGRTAATALGQLTWSANRPSLAGWAEAARVGCPLRALGRNSCSRRRWAAMQASTTSASRRLRRLGLQRPRARPARAQRAKVPERAPLAELKMQFLRGARAVQQLLPRATLWRLALLRRLAWQRRRWPRPGSWRWSRPRSLPAPPRRSLQRELQLLLRAVASPFASLPLAGGIDVHLLAEALQRVIGQGLDASHMQVADVMSLVGVAAPSETHQDAALLEGAAPAESPAAAPEEPANKELSSPALVDRAALVEMPKSGSRRKRRKLANSRVAEIFGAAEDCPPEKS